MNLLPLRLQPGDDLRQALEHAVVNGSIGSAFVVAGIGSLHDARLRLAGHDAATVFPGPSEMLMLSGSLSADGAHLHMAISTDTGQVYGGHVVLGNRVRTTAEILIASLADWQLHREPDAGTGYPELVVHRRERP